jgi:hypothetical protein
MKPGEEELARAREWFAWLQQAKAGFVSPATRESINALIAALDGLDAPARELLAGLATLPDHWPPGSRYDTVEMFRWAAQTLFEGLQQDGRRPQHNAYRFGVGFLVRAWWARQGCSPLGHGKWISFV